MKRSGAQNLKENRILKTVPANMSKSKTGGVIYIDYVAKKEVEIPVAPCQGWTDPCDFCDKRFGKWLEATKKPYTRFPPSQESCWLD
ncbi:hypothetical protein CDAR_550681 [Caerostris darwini]|uniref:Uncharacterized protein n=1 Tax=Caerostris darwini TaxID=1538125 RepID=A0AAV4NRJ4_9ARAC|nr:hypothetical protein CDAR_550681 [Caerostris darwini]